MSERDKWARIPATVYEIQQDFCAWEFGSLPCQAGPQTNIQLWSGDFGLNDIWTTDGTVALEIFLEGVDDTHGGNRGVILDPESAQSITILPADRARLPVFTENQVIYMTFVFDPSGASDAIDINMVFTTPSGETKVGFVLDTFNLTASSADAAVNDINFTKTGFTFYTDRISFWVDTADLFADGVAYNVFTEFSAISGSPSSEDAIFILPQLSIGGLSEYRQTQEEPILKDEVPCFNTLSTCHAPQTYTIKGITDGLVLSGTSKTMTYSGLKEPQRQEGIFIEFYIYIDSDLAISGDNTIIDIGGELSVIITNGRAIRFSSAGGAQVTIPAFFGEGTFRVAAFLSKGGVLTVRGQSESSSGGGFSAFPSEVTFNDIPSASEDVGLSDVLIYGYEAKDINAPENLERDRQKGDLFGDAFFYARFNRKTRLLSDLGVSPTGTFTDDDIARLALSTIFNVVPLNARLPRVELYEPPLVLRFTERDKSSRLPETLRAIPSLASVSNRPAQLSVGGTNENIGALGSRDENNASFIDHPSSDLLVDPYVDQRTYDPIEQGTFWGKWLARNQYREGFSVKHVSGYELPGGGFERAHEYNYVIDKVSGPDGRGRVNIKSYDILQNLRADRAVFPAANTGRLAADIAASGVTTIPLQPVGIGDDEYPTGNFRVRIGGEGFDVSRTGGSDDLTILSSGTDRGLYGGAESHSEDDLVQVVERIQSQQVHNIAFQIITTAISELKGNIPKDKWDGLAADFLPRLYSADITEPTGVEDLLGELTRTAPIYFYTDVRSNTIELGVIREPSQVSVRLDEGQEIIGDSVKVSEFPKERLDEVWVYYRIRNAAGDLDEPENYSQRFILVNPEEQERRGRRSIKRIYTRWIEAGARDTAEEIAQAYISRFQNTPIRVSFDLDAKEGDIWLGDVAKLVTRQKQDQFGNNREDINYQVIQADETDDGHKFRYIAQSYEFFSPVEPASITITIQPEDTVDDVGAVDQIDLRELYDSVVATQIDEITFVVAGGPLPAGGAVVGAGSGQTWSLRNPNNWPWAPSIEVRVEPGAVVAGRGGDGGDGAIVGGTDVNNSFLQAAAEDGAPGQTGFLVGYATSINNLGIIGGGGGGGGGSGPNINAVRDGGAGGGGAGRIVGQPGRTGDGFGGDPNNPGEAGTTLTGGDGGSVSGSTLFDGGDGGDLGQPGTAGDTVNGGDPPGGPGGAGGSPGAAINGIINVTYITRGDIRGSEV